MRLALMLFLLLSSASVFSQSKDSISVNNEPNKTVSFLAKVDLKQATKDGIYLNGYVVNIPYTTLKELNGKTIRVTGVITIVKGNKRRSEAERQGRQQDSKHILKPKIKIVES